MPKDKVAEEKARHQAAKKEEMKAKVEAVEPPLQVRFGFISKDSRLVKRDLISLDPDTVLKSSSERHTMSNPDVKILARGRSVEFFMHREVLIACRHNGACAQGKTDAYANAPLKDHRTGRIWLG